MRSNYGRERNSEARDEWERVDYGSCDVRPITIDDNKKVTYFVIEFPDIRWKMNPL